MKETLTALIQKILSERFGKDSVISLATVCDGIPYVRNVNAYYEDGAFYVITYALSNKMKHIQVNPVVAVSGEWFTGHGTGQNLGPLYKEENVKMAEKLQTAFASWYYNGHNDYTDPNTCILRICLTDGALYSNGIRYDLDFKDEIQ